VCSCHPSGPRTPLDYEAVAPLSFAEAELLGDDNWDLVAGFTCARPGCEETDYEREVSTWLTGTGSDTAREAIRLGMAEVGLHVYGGSEVVGFAAIGTDNWSVEGGSALRVWLLHYFGVHTNYRGSGKRFGPRILKGALEEMSRRGGGDFAALYVAPENYHAIDLYDQAGFQCLDLWNDPEDGRSWLRMIKQL
jgi:ribosomal protein S18 acetylase RimI-like enzyme